MIDGAYAVCSRNRDDDHQQDAESLGAGELLSISFFAPDTRSGSPRQSHAGAPQMRAHVGREVIAKLQAQPEAVSHPVFDSSASVRPVA